MQGHGAVALPGLWFAWLQETSAHTVTLGSTLWTPQGEMPHLQEQISVVATEHWLGSDHLPAQSHPLHSR